MRIPKINEKGLNTMIIKVMSPRGLGTIIYANFQTKEITIENKTDRILDTAFGVNQNPTWSDFEDFLESRCFPRTRDRVKMVLKDIGIDYYDPLQIIRKTEGRMAEDNMYLEIEDER